MPQRPRDKPPAAAAPSSGHESDGDEVASSCEIGENEAELVGRQPRQKRKGAAELAEKETSSASRLKKRKGDQAQSPPRKKRNKAKGKSASAYAADEVARSPSPEQDATAEEFPTPNNDAATSVAAAGTPPPTAPADNATTTARAVSPKNDAYDAEKRLKEKSETYWHLWRMVLALEKDHGVRYKAAFLKMREDRARTLNNKFKRLCLREVSLQLLGKDNRVRVARAMLKNIPR